MVFRINKEFKTAIIKRLTLIAFILVLLFSFRFIMFTNSVIICGKVYSQSNIRGATYLNYKFEINNKIYYGSQSTGNIKDNLSFETIKNTKCLKIEYSKFWKLYNRIIDERIID